MLMSNVSLCDPSCGACCWSPSEKHGGYESHAEPRQDPGDPGHHEGPFKGDDEGPKAAQTVV